MNETALILMDVQKGFDDSCLGERNNPNAEDNIIKLLSKWRERDFPIIHIKHCSLDPNSPFRPNQPGNDFKEGSKPLKDEKIFTKTVNSAFIGTALERYLHSQNLLSLVFVGFTTDHCVSTSVRMAANLGFEVIVISDATVAFERESHDKNHYSAEEIHNIHLTSLNGEFCKVKNTTEMLNLNTKLGKNL